MGLYTIPGLWIRLDSGLDSQLFEKIILALISAFPCDLDYLTNHWQSDSPFSVGRTYLNTSTI